MQEANRGWSQRFKHLLGSCFLAPSCSLHRQGSSTTLSTRRRTRASAYLPCAESNNKTERRARNRPRSTITYDAISGTISPSNAPLLPGPLVAWRSRLSTLPAITHTSTRTFTTSAPNLDQFAVGNAVVLSGDFHTCQTVRGWCAVRGLGRRWYHIIGLCVTKKSASTG